MLLTLASSVHDALRVPRHQAFMMMPWVAGKLPVPMVACPAQVTVLRYG